LTATVVRYPRYGAGEDDAASMSLGSIVGSGSSGSASQPTSRSSSFRSSRARVMRQ
jgi:hypothetical protein